MDSESVVKDRLPQIHAFVLESQKSYSWDQIEEDLEKLKWLDLSLLNKQEILAGVIKVSDAFAIGEVTDQPRFPLVKINQVRLIVSNLCDELIQNRVKTNLTVFTLKSEMQNLEFYKIARDLLRQTDNLSQEFIKIHNAFRTLRIRVSLSLSEADKSFKYETGRTIKDFLNYQFFDKVKLSQFIADLQQDDEVADIFQEYLSSAQMGSNFNKRNNWYESGLIADGGNNYKNLREQHVQFEEVRPISHRENIYLGELDQNGRRGGYGKMNFSNGDIYEGFWRNDKQHGKGVYKWKNRGRYEGDFENGNLHGQGRRIYPSGNIYVGQFQFSKKNGSGEMRFKNGDRYEGEWKNDDMSGHGFYFWSSGDTFEGEFDCDRRDGDGVLTLQSGEQYETTWKRGKMILNKDDDEVV